MGRQPDADDRPARVLIVAGLGPGDLDRTDPSIRDLLSDPSRRIVVRTIHHPAAEQLARVRPVEACDDLYEAHDTFEEVYEAIARRVVERAADGPAVYAVPGSPLVGEFAVDRVRDLAAASGIEVSVRPAESFLDAICAELRLDPLRDGLQVLDGHDLPTPLVLDKPTIVAHLDRPEVLADVAARLGRVVPEGTTATVLAGVGAADARVVTTDIDDVDPSLAGYRTSLYLAPAPGGLVGAVHTMHRLRSECPWDRRQTHTSLVKNLIEESHELAEALAALPEGDEPDYMALAEVEDELGDVLLQVLFHAAIGREDGTFDIDDVGERLRLKLVRRHPHVFGDVEVSSADEVKRNWDRIKAEERGDDGPASALDGVPSGMPALPRAAKIQNRAAKVGFDWPDRGPVLEKVREELAELEADLEDPARAEHELGDLLFAVVNLSRHLRIDPEVALRRATARFEGRFRGMEADGPLDGLSLEELDRRWEDVKRREG